MKRKPKEINDKENEWKLNKNKKICIGTIQIDKKQKLGGWLVMLKLSLTLISLDIILLPNNVQKQLLTSNEHKPRIR